MTGDPRAPASEAIHPRGSFQQASADGFTLVYLISRLGVGDGRSCSEAMSAAGSAFTSPGMAISLEVMGSRGWVCAGRCAAGARSLYIGRCQAATLLIGRAGPEARGAGP